MRIAMLGIMVTAFLCAGCEPAVGSQEWCDKMVKAGPEAAAKLPPDQQQKMGECVAKAMLTAPH